MRPEDYPPQQPIREATLPYIEDVSRRGEGIALTEIRYGENPYQSIALQSPEQPTGAVLAMAHGGGWTGGYKEHLNFLGPAFTAHGIVFASIGYRLAPDHLFPTGVEDVADALAWLWHNVAEHGGDPAHIFVGGHSAGAHYAAHLAVRTDWQAARGVPVDVIRGCLPISGVYRFGPEGGMTRRPGFLRDETDIDPASPILRIAATPPFLMAYGSADFPHLITQAEAMETALRAAGGEASRLALEGRTHFSACGTADDPDGPWLPAALDFIAR